VGNGIFAVAHAVDPVRCDRAGKNRVNANASCFAEASDFAHLTLKWDP
jgi:hypothetical protein